MITVHLRGVGHSDVVEGRSLPRQGPQLWIHGRIDGRTKILWWWIQLIIFDVQREVQRFHDRRWDTLHFAHARYNLRLQGHCLLHLFELLISLINSNIETVVELNYLLLVGDSQVLNVNLSLSQGVLDVGAVVSGRQVVCWF